MNRISADFNARNEWGHLRLNFPDSAREIRDAGLKTGDWAWFSDGELVIGGQLIPDGCGGVLGALRCNTLVHLDDDGAKDLSKVKSELRLALERGPAASVDDETRIYELLTIFETIVPPESDFASLRWYYSRRRAIALHTMGELELAMIEIEDARRATPDDPDLNAFYLQILRKIDPVRAVSEAEFRAEDESAGVAVLAACINIWTSISDSVADYRFDAISRRILGWIERFDRALDRDPARDSARALVFFNQGLVLLRLGRRDDARVAFERAHSADPLEPSINEALRLEVFDDRAPKIAAEFRDKLFPIAA